MAHASVLVVDDDPVVLLMQMGQMLRGIGVRGAHRAQRCRGGGPGRAPATGPWTWWCATEIMPEMDGVEMIRRLGTGTFRGGLILMSGADEQILNTVGEPNPAGA